MIKAISAVNHYNFVQSKNKTAEKNNNFVSLPRDIFVRSKNISFGAAYTRDEALNYIEKINRENIQPLGRGFQGAFYKMNKETGIKVPSPLHPEAIDADIQGINNIKEHYALNKIQAINPEIAVKPIDLIQKDSKNYLVMDIVKGEHPFNTKLNNSHFADIMQKTFFLDINGIAHSDLQSGNIFLNGGKAKFIDFGSYNLLSNEGRYISSEILTGADFIDSNLDKRINSPLKGKFLAVFYNNDLPYDLKNYSDNRHLNIKSNASNFEFRTIYDYLKHGKSENPAETLIGYLKAKSEYYHKPMAEFLESLDISPTDTKQLNQRKAALENEKLFAEIFSNPSEKVLKSELGKIQLKWLINDHKGANTKAFDYFNNLMTELNGYAVSSNGQEQRYFTEMNEMLVRYKDILNTDFYKGAKLEDKDNLVKIIFEKVKETVQEKIPVITEEKPVTPPKVKSSNRIILIISAIVVSAVSTVLYLYNKHKTPVKKVD